MVLCSIRLTVYCSADIAVCSIRFTFYCYADIALCSISCILLFRRH